MSLLPKMLNVPLCIAFSGDLVEIYALQLQTNCLQYNPSIHTYIHYYLYRLCVRVTGKLELIPSYNAVL